MNEVILHLSCKRQFFLKLFWTSVRPDGDPMKKYKKIENIYNIYKIIYNIK